MYLWSFPQWVYWCCVFEQATLTHCKYCRCVAYGGITLHVAWLKTHFTVQHFILPSIGWFNEGKHTYSTAALSGLQQWGEFGCTMMLTDRPTIPVVFKISTISLPTLCDGEREGEREESYTFFYPEATARCLYSLSLGGREASLLL